MCETAIVAAQTEHREGALSGSSGQADWTAAAESKTYWPARLELEVETFRATDFRGLLERGWSLDLPLPGNARLWPRISVLFGAA